MGNGITLPTPTYPVYVPPTPSPTTTAAATKRVSDTLRPLDGTTQAATTTAPAIRTLPPTDSGDQGGMGTLAATTSAPSTPAPSGKETILLLSPPNSENLNDTNKTTSYGNRMPQSAASILELGEGNNLSHLVTLGLVMLGSTERRLWASQSFNYNVKYLVSVKDVVRAVNRIGGVGMVLPEGALRYIDDQGRIAVSYDFMKALVDKGYVSQFGPMVFSYGDTLDKKFVMEHSQSGSESATGEDGGSKWWIAVLFFLAVALFIFLYVILPMMRGRRMPI